jgi:hypothetical protein
MDHAILAAAVFGDAVDDAVALISLKLSCSQVADEEPNRSVIGNSVDND